ncbi:hypothetical protein JW813_07615 [Clostridium botulinum]|uniref:hypothetical protein n=1 Tax=Clostridium botulinum TaxID=1491 RepID=UPI001C9A3AFB|nr:hypothetical protein [Clostridium botulinum]MBY6809023.1 hypothetical protein [Clostridium botulinum]MBY6822272.1 hypothetical protein [Clostridium botulinum]MBY6832938.1 hypothetical protein [Clostridium botulinum]MBY6972166.1 hypothetical protein [Clostridium botulinum]UZP04866.1 hypothetical protein JW813_07615 [Clostridium botulinum]
MGIAITIFVFIAIFYGIGQFEKGRGEVEMRGLLKKQIELQEEQLRQQNNK